MAHNVPLDGFGAFVDQELGNIGPGGSTAIPSARTCIQEEGIRDKNRPR